MPDAIVLRELRKTFGPTVALDGLDLTVATGEVHGFLGPNGAGKSTAIRILLGLLRSDGGHARLLDGDPWHDCVRLHRRLAYVPGDVMLWPTLSGGEVIDLLGRLRGGLNQQRRDELLERFSLDPRKRSATYSKGNRQKVALVAALASDVELLILDEPTAGLDPLIETVFRDCVAQVAAAGRTVLLSSHVLSEVEALCDRITIIREGVAVESGTLRRLRHLRRTSVIAELAGPAFGQFAGMPGVHDLEVDGAEMTCQVDPAGLDGLLRALADAGVRALTTRPPTLEELFLRHYDRGEGRLDRAVPTDAPAPEPYHDDPTMSAARDLATATADAAPRGIADDDHDDDDDDGDHDDDDDGRAARSAPPR
jgi:ABC-2 type transport system ATP-binding protein